MNWKNTGCCLLFLSFLAAGSCYAEKQDKSDYAKGVVDSINGESVVVNDMEYYMNADRGLNTGQIRKGDSVKVRIGADGLVEKISLVESGGAAPTPSPAQGGQQGDGTPTLGADGVWKN